jgi:hypothetical protein
VAGRLRITAMILPLDQDQHRLPSAGDTKTARSRVATMRAALVVGLVSALASLAGSKAGALSLGTAEVIGFLALVVVMVIVELDLMEQMKDVLAARFGRKIEQGISPSTGQVGRLPIIVTTVFVTLLLEEVFRLLKDLFHEHPSEAAVVAVESLIVPAVITYAWIQGVRHAPRRAARYGASTGALLGASFGILSGLTMSLVCLSGGRCMHHIPGIPSGFPSSPSAETLAPALTLPAYLVILAIGLVVILVYAAVLAVLVGLAGAAGIVADNKLYALRPRLALALAAVVANIPFISMALVTFAGNSWIMMGGSMGAAFGWAGAFALRRSVPLPRCERVPAPLGSVG